MRIDYRILWFEDNKASYNTKKDFIKDIVEDFSFNFIEPQNEIDGKNLETLDYANYDLIIADMTLSGGVTAMTLMEAIRKKSIFTEVLFYSSDGEEAVRAELAKHSIDGAYCSGRDNEDFEYKAKEVIRTLIKKTQDLTNMRGLVMAEVSELDHMMEEIIIKYFTDPHGKTIPERESLFKEIMDGFDEDYRNNLKKTDDKCSKKCIHKIRNKSIVEIVSSLFFESYKKARTIDKIIRTEGIDVENFLDNYQKEIIDIRNLLAHCESKKIDGKEVLVTKKGNEEVFDDNRFIDIRRNIIKYHKVFQNLKF